MKLSKGLFFFFNQSTIPPYYPKNTRSVIVCYYTDSWRGLHWLDDRFHVMMETPLRGLSPKKTGDGCQIRLVKLPSALHKILRENCFRFPAVTTAITKDERTGGGGTMPISVVRLSLVLMKMYFTHSLKGDIRFAYHTLISDYIRCIADCYALLSAFVLVPLWVTKFCPSFQHLFFWVQ
jgi:hypothetical protein